MTRPNFSELTIDQSLQLVSDQWEILVNDAQPYFDRNTTEIFNGSIGLLDAIGGRQMVAHITSGKIDEFELEERHNNLSCRVRGRDAAAYMIETSLYITYITGGKDWRVFNPPTPEQLAFINKALPTIQGVTRRKYKVGTWRASTVCADIIRELGAVLGVDLACAYQAPDYILREDVEVSGPVIQTIQQLVQPFSQFEPYKVDIWVDGKTVNIRSRQGLAEDMPIPGEPVPGPLNTLNVTDARILQWHIRARFLDYIRLVHLSGAGLGPCQSLKTEVTQEEIFDETGTQRTSLITTTRTIRLPDEACLNELKETYGPDDSGIDRLMEKSQTTHGWDDLVTDQNCRVLNSPKRRFSRTETWKINDDGVLANFALDETNYIMDDLGFLVAEDHITKTFDTDSLSYKNNTRQVKTYQVNGSKEWEQVVSTYSSSDGKWALQRRESTPAGGFRPGGSGRSPSKNQINVPPVIIADLIDNLPGARDFSYQNDNLLLDQLKIILAQARGSSGAWEYELTFTAVNIPWLRRGQIILIQGLQDANGNPVTTQPALVSEVHTEYRESSLNPTSTSRVKALWWSKRL